MRSILRGSSGTHWPTTADVFAPPLDKYKARFVDATGTTPPLLQGELFYVVDGKIQITPCNTKYLFGVLKDRVTRIVEESA